MSEEKLYAVKNDEGRYWDFEDRDGFWELSSVSCPTTAEEKDAKDVIHDYGGHVVELVEAPAKVVVSAEEAEMLKKAKNMINPMHLLWMNELTHNGDSDGQTRLLRAYVNGWTVEKPKRYHVKVPKKWSGDDKHYWTKEQDGALTWAYLINHNYMIPAQWFTDAEITKYGLQDCEKVEVSNKGAKDE